MPRKINRVIYRLWHNKSVAGRVGYIGKDNHYPSRLNLKNRKKFDKDCRKLYRALHKYPLYTWHKDILAFGFRSNVALCKAEIRWIKKFDSKNKGYNCTDGGEGIVGIIFTAEHRAKISESHKGKNNPMYGVRGENHPRYGVHLSTRIRKQISKALTGNKHPYWGKKRSASTRRKISMSKRGDKNPMSRVNREKRKRAANYDI